MRDYVCDRCRETLAGKFIEVHIEPRFLGVADDATLLGYAETQHLLETGCVGSLVEDTSFIDFQHDWIMGRRGIPLSRLPKEEQDEIRGLR